MNVVCQGRVGNEDMTLGGEQQHILQYTGTTECPPLPHNSVKNRCPQAQGREIESTSLGQGRKGTFNNTEQQ